ncbi:MAG: DNA repair and recombination protein RadB [Candidatus Thermoplasmatota archaeon]|nr:DNA repair and recombination protein RadB [Candidatus Thermoplasmatota archaeon]
MKQKDVQPDLKLPTGIGCIDEMLGGGFDRGVLNQVFGEGGVGKTNIAMQAAINSIQSGKKVIYIDTEGFSSTRFLQISKNNPIASKGMFLYRVMDLPDQEVAVIKAEKLIEKDREIDLLVMDSFTALMRLERDDGARNNSQMKQLKILNAISTEYDIGILITNQIYFDIGGGHTTPYGGFFLDHFSKVILELQKEKDGRRTITVKKHRALQDGISTSFYIREFGISCSP